MSDQPEFSALSDDEIYKRSLQHRAGMRDLSAGSLLPVSKILRYLSDGQLRIARGPKLLALIGSLLTWAHAASSHPHVFLDGGVIFVVDDDAMLRDVAVTWRYDAFETLYILTDMGFASAPENGFSLAERMRVEERLSHFADDFDGSVHLTAGADKLELEWPRDLSARMVGDRLEITFYRKLVEPFSLAGQEVSAKIL